MRCRDIRYSTAPHVCAPQRTVRVSTVWIARGVAGRRCTASAAARVTNFSRVSVGWRSQVRATAASAFSISAPRLHALARDAGATCLEPRWLGSVAMHRFRCAHGHSWQRQGRKALEQTGCPHCGHERAQRHKWHAGGLQQLQQAAARHGGQCLAEHYKGVGHTRQ